MAKFKVGDRVRYNGEGANAARAGAEAVVYQEDGEFIFLRWGRNGLDNQQMDGRYFPRHFEPAAVAPATAAHEIEIEVALEPTPAIGSPVLIPGWITAINTSRNGTVYSIAFETKNRRVSLDFTEEDFIPVDPDDDCPCFAENDNGPLPLAPNTAAAFDDLCGSIFGLTMRAA